MSRRLKSARAASAQEVFDEKWPEAINLLKYLQMNFRNVNETAANFKGYFTTVERKLYLEWGGGGRGGMTKKIF